MPSPGPARPIRVRVSSNGYGLALGPGDELDDHTATGTVDATDGIAEPDAKRPHVQVAPIALASVVNRMHPAHAARTPRDVRGRYDVYDEAFVVAGYATDPCRLQSENLRE